jgi:RNA polymerase sigma-70 factor (ECF subfamily)
VSDTRAATVVAARDETRRRRGGRTGAAEVTSEIEQYRDELTGHAYRMLGSRFEAEDAVQETLLRAWRGHDRFEGRAALRSWLYRIATNVCRDMLTARQRHARPMDIGPTLESRAGASAERRDFAILPLGVATAATGDPADAAIARESVTLALTAILRHLPPRQRAVLILRDVLRWRAREVAELLGKSPAAVNSALDRARAGIRRGDGSETLPTALDRSDRALLARYQGAFERSEIGSLTALLRHDAAGDRRRAGPR